MNQQTAAANKSVEGHPRLRLFPAEQIISRVNAFRQAIAARAFEIFSKRGRDDGHAEDDWCRAEAELFHVAHLDVSELNDAVVVRAEIAGFGASELQICVEPHHLTITGRRHRRNGQADGKVLYSDSCSGRIFRTLDIPLEMDASRTIATLNDGILELQIPRAAPPLRVWMVPKTDWIVRIEDYRVWNESLAGPEAARRSDSFQSAR
jgi:HSP20 family protein